MIWTLPRPTVGVVALLVLLGGLARVSPSFAAARREAAHRRCPPYPRFPDAGCTGPLTPTSLHAIDGDLVISTDGEVMEGLDVRGCIVVRANDVTIRNVRVHDCMGWRLVSNGDEGAPARGTLIEDCELDGQNLRSDSVGVGGANFTVQSCDIHNVGTGVHLAGHNVVADNFIHDLYAEGDPTENGSHNDAVLSNGADNLYIFHNELMADNVGPGGGVSAALALYSDFSPIEHAVIRENRFNGGGYCTHGGSDDTKPFGSQAHDISYRANRFGRIAFDRCGMFGPVAYFDRAAPGNRWEDNVWDDDGADVEPS